MHDALQFKHLSDEEVILLFQNGRQDAYDELVARFKDPLMNYITRYVGNQEDAEDVLQETFIRLYVKKDLYRTVARFSTWIYTIAINQARTVMRRSRKHPSIAVSSSDAFEEDDNEGFVITDPQPLPDELAGAALLHGRIQQALLTLQPEYREAVILRDIQNLEYEEIATMLEIPLGTVKSRINRGRVQLQKLLKDFHDSSNSGL